jgi:hypothetical protein
LGKDRFEILEYLYLEMTLRKSIAEITHSHLTKKKGFSKVELITIVISILALGISLLSIYFQFFYERSILKASIASCTSPNDSSLLVNIVYQNKGNQYETIISHELAYQKNYEDIMWFAFDTTTGASVASKPMVLKPGEHYSIQILGSLGFPKKDFKVTDTVSLSITINYLNEEGGLSYDKIYFGNLTIDSAFKIKDLDVYYISQTLKGNKLGGQLAIPRFTEDSTRILKLKPN